MTEIHYNAGELRAMTCFGDFASIQERLATILRKAIKKLTDAEFSELQQMAGRHKRACYLLRWEEQDVPVTSDLFGKLACPLGVGMAEGFGPPDLKEDDRTFFSALMEREGFVVGHPADDDGRRFTDEEMLNFFVYLLAIEEMDQEMERRKNREKPAQVA